MTSEQKLEWFDDFVAWIVKTMLSAFSSLAPQGFLLKMKSCNENFERL